jgi:hypothetical protein
MTLTRVIPPDEASARRSGESLSDAFPCDERRCAARAREPLKGAEMRAHNTNAAEAADSHPRRRLCFRDFKGSSTTDVGPKVSKCSEGIVRAVNGLVFYEQGPFQHSRRRRVLTETRAHLPAHARARGSLETSARNSKEPISLTVKEKRRAGVSARLQFALPARATSAVTLSAANVPERSNESTWTRCNVQRPRKSRRCNLHG